VEDVTAMMKIKLSEILGQADDGIAVIEPAHKAMATNPPPVLLWFLNPSRDPEYWFLMRLWIKDPGHDGFLLDPICNYEVTRDIPLPEFYDRMREHYVMARLTNSQFDSGEYIQYSQHAERLDLAYNRMKPATGYYSLGARLIRTHEGRP
jgi:hypothetical protein